jgi:hypothetical protein
MRCRRYGKRQSRSLINKVKEGDNRKQAIMERSQRSSSCSMITNGRGVGPPHNAGFNACEDLFCSLRPVRVDHSDKFSKVVINQQHYGFFSLLKISTVLSTNYKAKLYILLLYYRWW